MNNIKLKGLGAFQGQSLSHLDQTHICGGNTGGTTSSGEGEVTGTSGGSEPEGWD